MPAPEQQIPEYLHQTLGVRPRAVAWDGAGRLPAFLTARYRFALMDLEGQTLLLMVDDAPDPDPPASIRKHAEQVRAKWSGPIVYVRDQVTAYNRKRLIEQRIPFIVPGNQMYLPELGLDLRERFRAALPTKQKFSPATQAVLIFVLLNGSEDGATASALAPALGYTTMTLSRAFDELESAELATTEALGRERVLRLLARRKETWERAQPWLIDPVKSRHFVAMLPDGLRAGQDALARSTMIAEPRLPVTAVGHKRWLAFAREHPEAVLPDREAAQSEVEVWKYEPRAHDRPGVVDPLSLYLSVKAGADERVEQALDLLMEQMKW
jgi:DNA-binding MarR family transcriptional regulator